MPPTIPQIRLKIRDRTLPYRHDDDAIEAAIEDALAKLRSYGFNVDNPKNGEYVWKLQTALILKREELLDSQNRPVSSMSEAGTSISFKDITSEIAALEKEIADLIFMSSSKFIVVERDNY